MSIEEKQYKFYEPPKPVGYWVLGKGVGNYTRFAMWIKPTKEQIENHKTMLGWDWEDVA